MRATLCAILFAALTAACQAQPMPWRQGGQIGWTQGPYAGPMMAYGYCPGAVVGDSGANQGWYGPGMMGGGHMMGAGRGAPFDTARTDAWLNTAKTEIGVTPEQETLWSAYAEAVATDHAAMQAMHEQMPAMMGPGVNASDRLQAHVSLMSARLASLQQIEAATSALYAVLSADQRARANRVLWSGCW